MCHQRKFRGLLLAVGLFAACSGVAQAADPLSPTTSLVASAGAAPPTQSTFTVTGPQDLVVTLTDLQSPQPLTSLSVALTQGGQLAASYTLSNQTPSVKVPAANGIYTISVVGVPDASVGVGTFSVCVAPSSAPANCLLPGTPSLAGNVASFAGGINAGSATQDPTLTTGTFTLVVPAPGGTYTFSYSDFAFPVALSSSGALSPNPNLGLFAGSNVVAVGLSSGASFDLSPGTYTLLAVAQADATVKAGSYGITVTGPPGSAPLLDAAVPVGQLNSPSSFQNPASQALTLSVTDFGFPGPLAQAVAMVTSGGTALLGAVPQAGPVTSVVADPQGTLQLWTYASAGATAGTYEVDVAGGGLQLVQNAYGTTASSTDYAYAFVTPTLTANTQYEAAAVDLQFPSQLSALSFAVAHDGRVDMQSGGNSTIDFTPGAARAAVVLVSASTPASGAATGNGLFDVSVQTTGSSPQLMLDQTQAVSSTPGFFDSRTLQIDAAGNYDATLTDLKFPAAFPSLAVAVTQGGKIVGEIFGGGTFSFPATPGTYRLNFVATPQSAQQFGLYAVSMAYSKPTVSLKSSASSATSGSSITLSWTTTNATSCTASGGGFTGSVATGTGTQSVKLTDTTTYALQCTGPAGSASGSATVTATAASGGGSVSGGGKGALGGWELTLCGLVAAAAVRRRWHLRAAARAH
jgi:hypothetical protein